MNGCFFHFLPLKRLVSQKEWFFYLHFPLFCTFFRFRFRFLFAVIIIYYNIFYIALDNFRRVLYHKIRMGVYALF